MRQKSRWAFSVSVLCMFSAWPSAVWAGKPLENIRLVWKPTNRKDTGVLNLVGMTSLKFRVEPFVDSRPDTKKIGENQEDKLPKSVTTSSNVAAFCREHFSEMLRQYGLSVVAEGGDVLISGEVLEFMVIETNTYKGEVRLKVTVKRADKEEWIGVAAGTSSRFGRSYKAENYYETLSDALLDASERAVRDEGFRKASTAN
jgi:hypothetical protein